MTAYEPYGVRHFLRESDPEGVSELRRNEIPLLGGRTVEKGFSVDTDRIDPVALGFYRTLVLRRSPAQSRPPSPYRLIWQGEFYEAWQRPAAAAAIPERLPLSDRYDPIAEPDCAEIAALARSGDLVAARGIGPVIVPLSATRYPTGWAPPGTRYAPTPTSAGSIEVPVRVGRSDTYEIWIGGSLRPAVEVFVDGELAGETRHELNNAGGYVRLGSALLDPGVHRIEVQIGGADLHPGSGGAQGPIGPLVLSAGEAADTELVRVAAANYRELCRRDWDWVEVAG